MESTANNLMPNAFFNLDSLKEHIKKVSSCKKCNSKSEIIVMDFMGLIPENTPDTEILKINRCNYRNSDKLGVRVISQCACRFKEFAAEEEQKKLKQIETNRNNSGVPAIFKKARLTQFLERPGSEEMLIMTKGFIDNFEGYKQGGDGLYFYSKTSGNGKSFICSIIANELITKGYKVKYITTNDMLLDIRETFNSDSPLSEKEYLNSIYKNDLIIFDDFGLELEKNKTDWIVNELSMIFNNLYEKNKPFVITSNISLFELLEKLGEKRRIVSRIIDKVTFIENLATDKRQEDALKRLKEQRG